MIYVSRTVTTEEVEIDLDPSKMITDCVVHMLNDYEQPDRDLAEVTGEIAEQVIAAVVAAYAEQDTDEVIDLLDHLKDAVAFERTQAKELAAEIKALERENA